MCHKLDPVYFRKLEELDPHETAKRSLCVYDTAARLYRVPFLKWEYEVQAEHLSIAPATPEARPLSADLGLLLLSYLIRSKEVPLTNNWISEKELPGGALFFQGPHAIRNDEMAKRFGRDIEGFRTASRLLGGVEIKMGDAAYRLQVLPRIPAVAVLWLADEEFTAQARLLMDSSIANHLQLDVIFGMGLEVIGALLGKSL